MADLRRAWDQAVMRAESRSWIHGLLGRINDDASFSVMVVERPNFVYVRLGQSGEGDLTIARNDAGLPLRGNIPVKMRREDGILVVRAFDGDSNLVYSVSDGVGWGPSEPLPSPGDPFIHALDGGYHTGTLPWNSVSKTGSALDDLASRPHSALTNIGENDHHDKATAGDGIGLSGVGGQVIGVDNTVVRITRQILGGDGITGGGNLSADRTLSIELATLSGLELVGTPDKKLALADSVAGNGLVIANKILAVGAGNGITVGADTVSLTTPGTLSVTSQNDPVGNHTHVIDHSSNPGVAASLLSTSVTGSLQLVTLANNGTFVSGFAGNGYRIDQDVTEIGKTSAEFDNLTVRGRMRVYELLIQQIRATNGSVFISSSSTAEMINMGAGFSVYTTELEDLQFYTTSLVDALLDAAVYRIDTRIADPETGVLDDDRNLYHGFVVGDLIRAQRFEMDADGGFAQVRVTNMQVTEFHDLWAYSAVRINGDEPQAGDDFVRLGNTTDTTRQGSIYLTADDSNAPYIDIINDIASHADWNTAGKIKARVGRLTGITDSDFGGNLQGYGLYGNNVYLRGRMIITQGQIGTDDAILVGPTTTVIDGGKITTGIIRSNNWGTALGSEFNLATGVFRLGGSSAPKLSWDGTNLHIVGSITLTAPLAAGDVSGLGALATLNSAAWGSQVSGRPTELTDGRVAAALESTGVVKGKVKPTANAAPDAVSGLYLGADFMGYFNGTAWRTYMDNTGRFYLTGTGGHEMRWESNTLSINGSVTAIDGRIGGWWLASGQLLGGGLNLRSDQHDGTPRVEAGNGINANYAGLAGYTNGAAANVMFWAGQTFANRASAPFRVTAGGALTATSAVISGTIDATGGSTGGWSILPSEIRGGTGSNTVGLVVGSDPAIYAGGTAATAPFRVTRAGALFSSNATITGTVTANSGAINGTLTIGTSGLMRSGKTAYADDTNAGWWLGNDVGTPRFAIGNSTNNMRWTGTALQINRAALDQPSITGVWTDATMNSGWGWGMFGAGHQLRYVQLGKVVIVTGWVAGSTPGIGGNNDIIATGFPAARTNTFYGTRSNKPDNIGSSTPGRADVVYINTSGQLILIGTAAGAANWNLDMIINFVYHAN